MTLERYLKAEKKNPFYKKYPGHLIDRAIIRSYNKKLCKEYPFLIPKNRWSGEVVGTYPEDYEKNLDERIKLEIKTTRNLTDEALPKYIRNHSEEYKKIYKKLRKEDKKYYHYDYEYTEADSMPYGWRLAFGDQMLKEIKEELVKHDFLDKYMITDIKEKWGRLCWYDNGIPVGKLSEDYEVFERKLDDEYPEDWRKENIYYKYIESKNRKPVFKDGQSKEELDENIEYNKKNTVEVYHKHKIIEKCKVWEIVRKYEKLSEEICINCGKPAKYETKGWVNYLCEDCARKHIEMSYKNIPLDYKIEDYCHVVGEEENVNLDN